MPASHGGPFRAVDEGGRPSSAAVLCSAPRRARLPRMAVTSSAVSCLVEAVVARDLERARGLLHPEIDFRGMTPRQIWEAEDPAGVEDVLRQWLDDPDEEVASVEATDPVHVEDTVRVGWRVHARDRDGPFVFEQQVYAREQDGQIVWLRVMCSGPRPTAA